MLVEREYFLAGLTSDGNGVASEEDLSFLQGRKEFAKLCEYVRGKWASDSRMFCGEGLFPPCVAKSIAVVFLILVHIISNQDRQFQMLGKFFKIGLQEMSSYSRDGLMIGVALALSSNIIYIYILTIVDNENGTIQSLGTRLEHLRRDTAQAPTHSEDKSKRTIYSGQQRLKTRISSQAGI